MRTDWMIRQLWTSMRSGWKRVSVHFYRSSGRSDHVLIIIRPCAAPTRKQQELRLLQAQNRPEHPVTNSPGRRGAATWLATGLTIEESQISLARDVKRLGKHPTDMQLLRVARLRDKLQTHITSFLMVAPTYLGVQVDVNDPDLLVNRVCNSLPDDYEDDSDLDDDPEPDIHDTSIFQPELTVIPLPSNIGQVRCKDLGLMDLMKEETTLREGQANDALHAIRVHLVDKAVIFRNTVRSAKSQASSTRAWTQVRSVETAVNLNASIYSKCRLQLANLPDHDLLKKYLPLKKEDLKASSAVADPNARGQRDTTLSWFWSLDVQGDTSGNDWMTECECLLYPVVSGCPVSHILNSLSGELAPDESTA